MRIAFAAVLALAGLASFAAQDEPKPQPQPQPQPKPIPQPKPPRIEPRIQPRPVGTRRFEEILDAKDKILLMFEEEVYKSSSRGTDLEGNQWLYQLRMLFIRAKHQGDDSSAVRGVRIYWSVSPVPFAKGSTLEMRRRVDTLGPEEVDGLIRLLDQLEKAIAQKEPGFESASCTSPSGIRFYATYTTPEPVLGIYEEDPPPAPHPTGTLLHSGQTKTALKDLLAGLRKAKQKIEE
ncbi:MAG TPA: hypothetical protein VI643_05215 [Planctomycetota bacterium]|nr:hypothetical protein [Planctomycetota bacterium]